MWKNSKAYSEEYVPHLKTPAVAEAMSTKLFGYPSRNFLCVLKHM